MFSVLRLFGCKTIFGLIVRINHILLVRVLLFADWWTKHTHELTLIIDVVIMWHYVKVLRSMRIYLLKYLASSLCHDLRPIIDEVIMWHYVGAFKSIHIYLLND